MEKTNTYISKNECQTHNKTYITHDNGSRPFKVVANKHGIIVYTFEDCDVQKHKKYRKEVMHITDFLGYWSGYDSTSSKMHGNSILIQLTKNDYIHIGCEMYSFKTDDEIIDYVSPMGNNDVPYAVGYGTQNIYFMEGRYVKRSELVAPITVNGAMLLSQEFYGNAPSKEDRTHHRMHNKVMICRRLYTNEDYYDDE